MATSKLFHMQQFEHGELYITLTALKLSKLFSL